MDMKRLQQISIVLLGSILTQLSYAQSDTNIELSAATSTPFVTEEERTRALISEDRPIHQSLVELEEKIKDTAVEEENASHRSRRLGKLASRMDNRQKRLAKQSERLVVISEVETLLDKITNLETKLSAETDPATIEELQTKLTARNESLSQKLTRIDNLEEKIITLGEKLAADESALNAIIQDHRAKLETRLNNALQWETTLTQKVAELNAKLSTATRPTKIERIEKQLANKQYRAKQLTARIVKIRAQSDELEAGIESLQPSVGVASGSGP